MGIERSESRKLVRLLVAAVGCAAALIVAAPADAAFPGANGKIAFSSNRDGDYDIYTMNADGSGVTQLTNDPAADCWPSWSPDGRSIAFSRSGVSTGCEGGGGFGLWRMNGDGTGQTAVVTDFAALSQSLGDPPPFYPDQAREPAWSPDLKFIAFTNGGQCDAAGVWFVAVDLSQLSLVDCGYRNNGSASWSPDGTRLTYSNDRTSPLSEVWISDVTACAPHQRGTCGTNTTQITGARQDLEPNWSPDGTRIAYVFQPTFFCGCTDPGGVFTVKPDGTGATRLTSGTPTGDADPAWAPDGSALVFVRGQSPDLDVYRMASDGSGVVNLTNNAASDLAPDWQPIVDLSPASLDLSPATASNEVDTAHCVTATVKDRFDAALQDITIRFAVSGAVSAAGSGTSDAGGQAEFCYEGPALPGSDSITAYADTDGDSVKDTGEPAGSATKDWVLPASTPCTVKINKSSMLTEAGDVATFSGTVKQSTNSASGKEDYRDNGPAEPVTVSSQAITAVVCSGSTASVWGTATVNGSGSHAFRIDVDDQRGRDDTYEIRLDTGYDSGVGTLTSGRVQVRRSHRARARASSG